MDCGLFQGERVWRRRNWDELLFDPVGLDAVVLTHAHLDHSGACTVRGYSAHADADEIVQWARQMPAPGSVYVVHGESSAAAAPSDRLADELGWAAVAPRYLERVRLN